MPQPTTPFRTTFPDIFITALSILSLIINPTRRRNLSMNNPTRRHFATPQALSDWLKPRMPLDSFALWGVAPGTKNVHNLWLELNEGETFLADSVPPLRTVNVLTLRVLGSRNRVLVESGQELSDGSFRSRGRPLSEKMRPGESPESAAYRAVREELGSVMRRQGNGGLGLANVGNMGTGSVNVGNVGIGVEFGSVMNQGNSKDDSIHRKGYVGYENNGIGMVMNHSDIWSVDGVVRVVPGSYKKFVEERSSVSYPGLPACYVLHSLDAEVEGLPEEDFCTEEGEEYGGDDRSSVADGAVSVKRHHWKWVSADSV